MISYEIWDLRSRNLILDTRDFADVLTYLRGCLDECPDDFHELMVSVWDGAEPLDQFSSRTLRTWV